MNRLKTTTTLACFISSCITAEEKAITLDSLPILTSLVQREDTLITNYWVSEKLDGIRALWTGSKLVTRKGNELNTPAWFTKNFPSTAVEGELWAGRGRFSQVQQTVLAEKSDSDKWQDITFMLFDIPNSLLPYKQRYDELLKITERLSKVHVKTVQQQPVSSYAKLIERLEAVEQMQGEGLMLRSVTGSTEEKPIKLKKHRDAEGVVIGYKNGTGKYQGMVGSIIVRLDSGRVLMVGSGLSDELRSNPPPLGEVITYRYNGYTSSGLPKFARFVRIRESE